MKNFDYSERICVFRSGDGWFGFPSLSIRSVVPRPLIKRTPHSDPVLQGICHLQNEFIPVLSLRSLMSVQYETASNIERQLMIMLGPQGPWGLLIDQAVALVALETSVSSFSNRDDNWSKVIVGSASYLNHVLQVLDPTAIYLYASNLLESFWQDTATIESASEII